MPSLRIPSWVLPFVLPTIAGIGSYYAGQVTLEHRLTAIEDAAAFHAREDDRATAAQAASTHNLWFAINKNHGDPLP